LISIYATAAFREMAVKRLKGYRVAGAGRRERRFDAPAAPVAGAASMGRWTGACGSTPSPGAKRALGTVLKTGSTPGRKARRSGKMRQP
jgi:hypothetical protein